MQLTSYLDQGITQYHAAQFVSRQLADAGFVRLAFDEPFQITGGGRYYVMPYESVIFAFMVGEIIRDGSMHVACAHTDFPELKLKSHPQMICAGRRSMVQVNVEPYGGMLKRTWFDRPLGLAGKVLIKTEDPYAPKQMLFDSQEPWMILPSLAPHMDRDIEKKELDVQKEMIPVCLAGMNTPCDEDMLMKAIADKMGITASDILDYDLYLYNKEPACYVGIDGRMLSSARIDNLASVAALTEGLIVASGQEETAPKTADVNLIALFDNEEIGSRSKQGADSMLFSWITEKIYENPLFQNVNYKNAMAKSMMLSVDGAHALHPNYKEKTDPTNPVYLGGGIVLKTSASQRYVTDSRACAIVTALCDKYDIPVQKQVNRSGMPGGQTLGPIASSYLPLLAADMGIPMLAMHSARELCHESDYEALRQLMKVWFS